MTNQEYIRYLIELFMKRMIRRKEFDVDNNNKTANINFLQRWFGLFPLYLELWYKKK